MRQPQLCVYLSLFLWFIFQETFVVGLASIPKPPKSIPITVLSGFLGSGKTSLLQNLLHNRQGLRIAVIVNDVASVNIDSKLISSSTEGASGMVELQNGCACCSLSEELLGSVSELVMLSDLKGDDEGFHHIVIELSGVADPKSVRAKFQEAVLYDMPLMQRVQLDTMVTVIDCSSFLDYIASGKTATPNETPELFYRDGEIPPSDPSKDWMDDLEPKLLEALLAGGSAYGDSSPTGSETDSGVSELLVGQTETADILLLNKVDLVNDELDQIKQVAAALNPKATVYETEYGKIDLSKVLAVTGGRGVVEAGVVDDHRDAITAALHTDDCSDPACSHPSHSHEHSSPQDHSHDEDCADSDSNDQSYSHAHSHAAVTSDACEDPDCTDSSHSHSHESSCVDPDCSDTSHSHSHAHSETHAGIGTFVYRARRPFHPHRLLGLLRMLPVIRGLPEDEESQETVSNSSSRTRDALKKVLRSKGFTWCADSNIAALYWSHAGASFDMQCLGRWWATLPRDQWPDEAVSTLLADFDDPQHVEGGSSSVGDRRQEIVFIGQGLGNTGDQKCLQKGLDSCLLDDEEWKSFCLKRDSEDELRVAFVNPIQPRMASY